MPEVIKIETARLTVRSLTRREFRLLLYDQTSFEKSMGLAHGPVQFDDETAHAMQWLYREGLKHDTQDFFWYTNWQIIHRDGNTVIGSLCFKGAPDIMGVAEVGYGIDPAYRNNGYMKEALEAVCDWALDQQNVTAVIAETDAENSASQVVLQSCGMEPLSGQDGDGKWWKLDKNKT